VGSLGVRAAGVDVSLNVVVDLAVAIGVDLAGSVENFEA
jgi:hypothetical protein